MIIKTEQDWWDSLNKYWFNIRHILFCHIDPIADAYEDPGNKNSNKTGRSIDKELEYLRETKNPKLERYLNVVWCMASDAYAWSVPSWGDFCDLCSETYVLYETI